MSGLDRCFGAPNGGHTRHERDFSSRNLPVQCLVPVLLVVLHSGRQGPRPGRLVARVPATDPALTAGDVTGGIWGPGTYPGGDFDQDGMSEAAGSGSLQTQASLGDATHGGGTPCRIPLPAISHGLSQAARVGFIHQAVRHIVNGTRHSGSRALSGLPLSGFFCEPGFLQGLGDMNSLGS